MPAQCTCEQFFVAGWMKDVLPKRVFFIDIWLFQLQQASFWGVPVDEPQGVRGLHKTLCTADSWESWENCCLSRALCEREWRSFHAVIELHNTLCVCLLPKLSDCHGNQLIRPHVYVKGQEIGFKYARLEKKVWIGRYVLAIFHYLQMYSIVQQPWTKWAVQMNFSDRFDFCLKSSETVTKIYNQWRVRGVFWRMFPPVISWLTSTKYPIPQNFNRTTGMHGSRSSRGCNEIKCWPRDTS